MTTLSEALLPINTRKELADTVGIGEVTMGRVMQIDEHAPVAVKDALDNGDLSINQGYNITKQVQELPEDEREETAALAVELEKAKRKSGKGTLNQIVDTKLLVCSAKPLNVPTC